MIDSRLATHVLRTSVAELSSKVAELMAAVTMCGRLRSRKQLTAAEELDKPVSLHLGLGQAEEAEGRLGVGDQRGPPDGGGAHARVARACEGEGQLGGADPVTPTPRTF